MDRLALVSPTTWLVIVILVVQMVRVPFVEYREWQRKRDQARARVLGQRVNSVGLEVPAASQPREDAGPYESRDSDPAAPPPRH